MNTNNRPDKGFDMTGVSSNPAYSDAIELFEQACDGYRRFHILKAAIDLDLFSWLAEFGPASAARIVEVMGLEHRYVAPFLLSLAEDGFLEQRGSKFVLSEAVAKLQKSGAPVRPAQILARTGGASARWQDLVALLHGREVNAAGDGQDYGICPGDYFHAERAVYQWPQFERADWLLDLGGTGGELCMVLCKEHPTLCASILASASEAASLKQRVAKAGLAERIELIEGDLFSADFHREYDIVLAVHSLYAFPKRILAAMEKIAALTNPLGLLVTQHWFDDGQDADAISGVRELDQRLHQPRRPLRHAEAFGDRVTSAGFSWLQGQNLPAPRQGLQLRLAIHCDEDLQASGNGATVASRRSNAASMTTLAAL